MIEQGQGITKTDLSRIEIFDVIFIVIHLRLKIMKYEHITPTSMPLLCYHRVGNLLLLLLSGVLCFRFK